MFQNLRRQDKGRDASLGKIGGLLSIKFPVTSRGVLLSSQKRKIAKCMHDILALGRIRKPCGPFAVRLGVLRQDMLDGDRFIIVLRSAGRHERIEAKQYGGTRARGHPPRYGLVGFDA